MYCEINVFAPSENMFVVSVMSIGLDSIRHFEQDY